MSDPVPPAEDPRASSNDRNPSGLTPFLAGAPDDPQASIESLRADVRALIRERDYLRELRDAQLAELTERIDTERERAEDLQQQLNELRTDRQQWKDLADHWEQQNEGQRSQVVRFLHQLSAQRLRTAAALRELTALQESLRTSPPS